jgi:hypothetical protein
MRKAFLALLCLVTLSIGGIFMVEDYTEDSLYFPAGGTYELASVTFQLEQPSITTILSGGTWYCLTGIRFYSWLILDGDSLGISTEYLSGSSNFMIDLEPGMHTFKLMVHSSGSVINPRLQVLVNYNDAGSVSEVPPKTTPIESRTVLSSGNAVVVSGCTEVVDLTGRVVSSNPPQGRIELNALPSGTYLARTADGRAIKIVKL